METLYYDLQVGVERNIYGVIVVTADVGEVVRTVRSEQYYGYSIADAVERFAEEHGIDLSDSIENMRQELGEIVDVCPDEETEDAE